MWIFKYIVNFIFLLLSFSVGESRCVGVHVHRVHICVGSCMYIHVQVYTCAYGEQMSTLNVIPQEPATLIFQTGSLIGLELDE